LRDDEVIAEVRVLAVDDAAESVVVFVELIPVVR
jgi:hypothetical protein